MLWYGIFTFLICFFLIIQQNYTLKFKLSTSVVFLFAFILIVFVVIRPSTLPDYSAYYNFYTRSNLNHESFEFFSHLIRIISPGWYFFLFVFALLSISLKLYAIKLNSDKHILSILTYISTSFVLHDFIQIRASCAIGIIWVALYYLIRRKILIYLILISLASLFHVSAMIFFPMVILKADKINKFFWLFLIVISYLVALFEIDLFDLFFQNFQFEGFIMNKITMYYNLAQNDATHSHVNIFSTIQLLRIILFFIILLKLKLFNDKKILFLKIYVLGICVLPLFSNVAVIAFRFEALMTSVMVFILPEIICFFKNKLSGYFLYLGFIACLFFLNIIYPNFFII